MLMLAPFGKYSKMSLYIGDFSRLLHLILDTAILGHASLCSMKDLDGYVPERNPHTNYNKAVFLH